MPKVTFVLSIARSRTFWLSNVLQSPDADGRWGKALHEPMLMWDSLGAMYQYLDACINRQGMNVAVADTSFIYFYEQLRERYPDAQYVFILRDPAEVADSLSAIGIDPSGVAASAELLGSILRYTPPAPDKMMVVNVEELSDPDIVENIFRFTRSNSSATNMEAWVGTKLVSRLETTKQICNPHRLLRLIHSVEPVSDEEQEEMGVYLDDSYADDPDMYTVYGDPEPLCDLPDCEMCSSESQEEEPRF